MMTSAMNKQPGMKWFTFYTKVRPWCSVVTALLLILSTREYMNNWYLLLAFLGQFAQATLGIIVWVKSSGDYGNFVRFVDGVLFFETIYIAYCVSITEYGFSEIVFLFLTFISYFIWYRPNIKYFKKRQQFTIE